MIHPRPIPMSDPARPPGALPLAGGPLWFDRVELLARGAAPRVIAAPDLDPETRDRLSAPRPALAGLSLDRPRIMGILNVTPDSFSDGGRYLDAAQAEERARALVAAGAEILDVGGESTRPGAAEVPAAEEIARVLPAIRAAAGMAPVSIDTRKAAVAEAAFAAGVRILNDVAALGFDPDLGPLAAARGTPVILMHMRGTPATMQDDPRYDDVVLDVFDELSARLKAAEAMGIRRDRLVADPGIGFAKTARHNLALIRRLSLFHALGVPLMLGASRKRFIGTIGAEPQADRRGPGSLAVALEGARQGAHILRVHDVAETKQALALWSALNGRLE